MVGCIFKLYTVDICYRLHTNKFNILYNGYDREKLSSSKEALKMGSRNTKDRVTQYHEFKIEKTASVSDKELLLKKPAKSEVRSRTGLLFCFWSEHGVVYIKSEHSHAPLGVLIDNDS